MAALPFEELTLILFASLATLLLMQRMRIPELLGFLLTGWLLGPHGSGLVHHGERIETVAELGVILLLFTLGLEFSLKHLVRIRRLILTAGSLQIGITIIAAAAVFMVFGHDLRLAIFLGFLVSLSSTAIVLRMLEKKRLLHSPAGNISLAILLMQDLAVVPMALAIPLLAGSSDSPLHNTQYFIGRMLLVVLFIGASRWILLPKLLSLVSRSQSQELFIVTVFAWCIGGACLTGSLGLSYPLGAFIAGLLLSESDHGYQAFNTAHVFKELFASFFFISVGMLLDTSIVTEHFSSVLGFVFVILFVKLIAGCAAVKLLKYPFSTSMAVALMVNQVGEFSLVLAQAGLNQKLMDPVLYQVFLASAVITMAAGPFLIGSSGAISERIAAGLKIGKKRVPGRLLPEKVPTLRDHLIIIGYGLNGRNLAMAAKTASIPYIIVELNPDLAAREKQAGESIVWGDASYAHTLQSVHIENARVCCIAISDPFATRKVVDAVERLNPSVYTIVRTREVNEVGPLLKLGADDVIPEEFETSLEIFSRVLNRYLVPQSNIAKLVYELRRSQYQKMAVGEDSAPFASVTVPTFDVQVASVPQDFNAHGKTLGELHLRQTFGVHVVAIQRAERVIEYPGAGEVVQPRDLLYVLGSKSEIKRLWEFLSSQK